jgi:DNA-binding NarL/FixJ family response regulator
MTGIEAAREIRKAFPSMLIMLVTLEPGIVDAAREAGIRGSLSKMALCNLAPGIRAMLRGEEFHQLRDTPSRASLERASPQPLSRRRQGAVSAVKLRE